MRGQVAVILMSIVSQDKMDNFLSTIEGGSGFLLVRDMRRKRFKSTNPAYKHLQVHINAALVSRERKMDQSDMGPRCRRRANLESMKITPEFEGGRRGIAFVSPDQFRRWRRSLKGSR